MEYFAELGYDMFDATVFSCAEGVAKPDPEIYAVVVERLGVAAEDAVLIDDSQRYVEGALGAGLKGIVFESVEQVHRALAGLGVETGDLGPELERPEGRA